MNPLNEIKALVDRLNRGVEYLDREGSDTDKGLLVFHSLSVELAVKVVEFEKIHGRVNFELLDGPVQIKMGV
jgi:hypothetical protein